MKARPITLLGPLIRYDLTKWCIVEVLCITDSTWGFLLCIITVPQKGEVGSGAAGNHATYWWWWLVGVASAVLFTTSIGCPA